MTEQENIPAMICSSVCLTLPDSVSDVYGRSFVGANQNLVDANRNFVRPNYDSDESNQPLSESNQTLGEANQTLGELNQTLSESNQTLSESNQSLGETNQTLGEANQSLGEDIQTLEGSRLKPVKRPFGRGSYLVRSIREVLPHKGINPFSPGAIEIQNPKFQSFSYSVIQSFGCYTRIL
jgi:hypothetical protein